MKLPRRLSFLGVLLSAMSFAQSNPVPLIYQPLLPTSTPPGGPGFTLTINGTGFASGSVVKWNDWPRATTFVGSSQVKASIKAADIANVGTASLTVTNPVPGGGTSNVIFFSITNSSQSVSFTSTRLNWDGLQSVSGGDFNGDGRVDIVIAYYSSIGILLGNGDGTFQPVVQYDTGGSISALAIGDYNRDGKLDVAAATYQNIISVFLGNGDGTFQPRIDYGPSIIGWNSMVTADFDGDGRLDLAAFSRGTTGFLLILHGNGDGTFHPKAHYKVGFDPPGLGVGDFNGDGKLDIVIASENKRVFIMLGNGDGTLQNPVPYRTRAQPQSVITADLNGDGNLDLIVGGGDGDAASVLLGNGDGTFQHHTEFGTGTPPTWPVAGDFNGDDKLDLALGSKGVLSLVLGNGDGTFQPPLIFPSIFPGVVFASDFDRDGRLDLAATSNGLNVILQTGAALAQ